MTNTVSKIKPADGKKEVRGTVLRRIRRGSATVLALVLLTFAVTAPSSADVLSRKVHFERGQTVRTVAFVLPDAWTAWRILPDRAKPVVVSEGGRHSKAVPFVSETSDALRIGFVLTLFVAMAATVAVMWRRVARAAGTARPTWEEWR